MEFISPPPKQIFLKIFVTLGLNTLVSILTAKSSWGLFIDLPNINGILASKKIYPTYGYGLVVLLFLIRIKFIMWKELNFNPFYPESNYNWKYSKYRHVIDCYTVF